MEANGGGGHPLPNGVLANGQGHANHPLPNGVLANGEGHANHAPPNGGGEHALPNGAVENGEGHANHALENGHAMANGVVPAQAANPDALYLAFLCLPAQEIARCRMVCTLWRDITRTDNFRRDHHRHRYRAPMPLLTVPVPGQARFILRAADTRGGAYRPLIRFPLHAAGPALWIHGSSAGILLVSSGNSLYICNPCTRRWAQLPPLHVDNWIIGFYVTSVFNPGGCECQVLYHNGQESDCLYRIFQLGPNLAPAARFIGRPAEGEAAEDEVEQVELDLVLADGIAPSFAVPPVHYGVYLCWLPRAAQGTNDILMFNTAAESFSLIPPPTVQVNDAEIPVGVGVQLFVLHEHLAMTIFSPAHVNVWVRSDTTHLWSPQYSILRPEAAAVFFVAQDTSRLMQAPYIMSAHHGIFLSGHTIQESLLLHPNILPLQDGNNGGPPFF